MAENNQFPKKPTKKNAESFDLGKVLSDIIDRDFDLTSLNVLDESNISIAPNFFVFLTSREFCNATLLPWQVEAGMHLFSEFCPKCTNPDYVEDLFDESFDEIKENICFLEHGVCPKCNKNKLELFSADVFKTSDYYLKNEFVGALGQRSGKSKVVVGLVSYIIHKWLTIPNPIEFYSLPTMELMVGTFSALTAGQAEENLWIPFKNLFDNSPWFNKYNEFLKEQEPKLGTVLVEIKDSYIYYKHKHLLIGFEGSDAQTQRGRTRLFAAIDELAFFNSELKSGARGKRQDADGSYSALNNSLSTLRQKSLKLLRSGVYDILLPCMFNVSSPLNVNDKIMKLIRGASNNAACLAIHRATWEANPDYNYQDLRQSNAGLSEIEFQRDFGAIPPYSDSPFISEPRVLEKLCLLNEIPIIQATKETFEDGMGDKYLYLKAKVPKVDKLTPRCLTLDNGFNNNAFSACIFRYDVKQSKPVLEYAISCAPDKKIGITINFPKMFEEFIKPIVEGLNIKNVFFDRWQSLDQIHRLRDMKIDAQAYSLKYELDFLPLKQQLISGNVILPVLDVDSMQSVKTSANPIIFVAEKPVANLLWQILTVREVGKKLLKPADGDDDIFRSFALGSTRFLNQEFVKAYLNFNNGGNLGGSGDRALGTFRSLSRGGSTASVVSPTGRAVATTRKFT